MGNQNSIAAEATQESPEPALVANRLSVSESDEGLELLQTLSQLPDEIDQLPTVTRQLDEINNERRQIIDKVRAMADYLADTHSNVLIADRVGTGVGIGSGVLFISGLIAAPFTAGLSLGLTIAGTTTGILGGVTSAGANITGYVISKNSLASLQEELKVHYDHLERLESTSRYLAIATRFRPTLDQMAQLTEQGMTTLISSIPTIATHIANSDDVGVRRVFQQVVDPRVKNILKEFFEKLNLPSNPALLNTLASICTDIINRINSIMKAIESVVNHLKRPELARLAMTYTATSAGKASTVTANEISEVKAAFSGTPMAMTKSARITAGVITTAFIVFDIIHMVQICLETGETPTVQQLRKIADDLEREAQTAQAQQLSLESR